MKPKNFLSHPWVHYCLVRTVVAYLRWVIRSVNWTFQGRHYPETFWNNNESFILCFWHESLMVACHSWPQELPFHMLVSMHRDGKFIADVVKYWGIECVYGSSFKGGMSSTRQLLRFLRSGISIGITPDGPRGPRRSVAPGIMALSRISGRPIIPLGCATAHHKILSSWDRFRCAFPYGSGALVWGKPLWPHDFPVKQEEGEDKFEQAIQESLNDVTTQAVTYAES